MSGIFIDYWRFAPIYANTIRYEVNDTISGTPARLLRPLEL